MLNIDRDKVSVLIAKFAHEVGAIVSIFFPGLIIPEPGTSAARWPSSTSAPAGSTGFRFRRRAPLRPSI